MDSRRRWLGTVLAAALAALGVAALGGLPPGRWLAAGPAEAAQAAGGERVIQASGEGVVRVRPDQATVSIGVETQAATAGQAQAENARRAQAVSERLLGLGLGREDLQTAWVGLSPVYEYGGGASRLVGYRALNQLRVRLADPSQVGRVLDAAVAAGANQVQGVAFGLRDEAAARREALSKAVEDARARAEAMATAAGVRLGEVVAVTEGGPPGPNPLLRMAAGVPETAGSAATPVEPGELEVRAAVTVAFAIR